MVSDKLRTAIATIKQGDKISGRKMLAEIIRADPSNEIAWLWLSVCVDDIEQKRYCLNRVLSINPDNQSARRALARLEQSSGPSGAISYPASPNAPAISQRLPEQDRLAIPVSGRRGASPSRQVAPRKRERSSTKWMALAVATGILILAILIGVIGFNTLFKPALESLVGLQTGGSGSNPTPTALAAGGRATPFSATRYCRESTQEYLAQIQPLMNEFDDTMQLASSTARIALSPIVQDLQRIRRDVMNIPAPDCAWVARNLLIDGMDGVINAFMLFMADAGDAVVEREMQQGLLDMTNGLEQLIALAAGEPTPIPRLLPTNTPRPTPLPPPTPMPTPTPLPAGSPIVLRDVDGHTWQIRVTKVLLADTLRSQYTGRIEKAAGRFAIVFMEVTNRGLSPATFVAFGVLEVQDATGRRFEEHFMGSAYAQDIYDTDICADINPDATKYCVAVYDISRESSFYLLVPGLLADPDTPKVLLNIP